MNKYRTYMLLLLSVLSLSLQAAIRVTAEAPQVVAQGEQFQLRFTVNSASVKDVHSLAAVNGLMCSTAPQGLSATVCRTSTASQARARRPHIHMCSWLSVREPLPCPVLH